jgi:hypothetical protein
MRNPLPLGSVAGGGVERKLNGEPVVNAKAIAVDALAGAVGDAAGGPADNGTKQELNSDRK